MRSAGKGRPAGRAGPATRRNPDTRGKQRGPRGIRRLLRWGGAWRRRLHVLGLVDRPGKVLESLVAALDHLLRLRPALVREEVPRLDLRQPAHQLLQVLLAFLQLSERELPGLGLLADLREKGAAALGELVVLPATIGAETLHDRRVSVSGWLRNGQHEPSPALAAHGLLQLLEKPRVLGGVRQHPGTVQNPGRSDGAQPAPQRDPRAGRRARQLSQEDEPARGSPIRSHLYATPVSASGCRWAA